MPLHVQKYLVIGLFSLSGIFACSSSPNPPVLLFETIQRNAPQFVIVDGHNIAYIESGQGDHLIFIHGFGGSMWNWEYQYKAFSASHHVIVLDLLGSGFSDKPDIPYTPQSLVKFFTGFLDALGIQKANLVGNSMGAGLAMAMAMNTPDRVKTLVLISGFPPDPGASVASPRYQQFIHRRPPLWLAKFGNWISGRWATKSLLEEIVHNHDLITPVVVERSFQNRQHSDFLPPLYSLMDHMEQWNQNFGHRIEDIAHPTLILWGSEDKVFPPEVGSQLQNSIPQSRIHFIPDAGHIPQWEKPAEVNDLIKAFLTHSLS